MIFHIPFTFSSLENLKKKSKYFLAKIHPKKKTKLGEELAKCDINITREEYLAICLRSLVFNFAVLFVVSTTILAFLQIDFFYLLGLGFAVLFSFFVFFSQSVYPSIYVSRRQRNIEKNLISALDDILIQINSGIPLFNVLVNVSSEDYGELSTELKKAVKKISAGQHESQVLDDLGKQNPSVFFRRTLWQISSGMNSGSDLSIVVKESIKALSEEQLIQIQNYGNKLNPLVVFYMLIAVIIPALSVTFLTILSSMMNMDSSMTSFVFIGLFIFVVLMQIMFIGLIKSKRPSLL